jgi:sphinganine-1-phosphate aldolase
MTSAQAVTERRARIPAQGASREELRRMLEEATADDVKDWEQRLAAGMTFPAGEDVLEVAKEAYLRFFRTNALYATRFTSLARFEREVVAWTADLLHGEHAVGAITAGGTESNLMAVKSARDRARAVHPRITAPEMVIPASAHPSLFKAAHYFGLKAVRTPLRGDLQLDLDAYRAAITDNTVLLVGSAPSLTLGMVEPIEEMAALAAERNVNFHVDACVGGYFLPFAERLGHPLPRFDFRLSGVTTISADLHKYGYTAKGASTLLSRDPEIFRYQVFRFGAPERAEDWYVTPTMAGTRPGGAIAAAWAVMRYLGEEGYLRLVDKALRYMARFKAGINAISGLEVLGDPAMTVFAYTSRTLDIFAIADGLEQRGWMVTRDTWPIKAIRFMQSPGHEPYVDRYLADLAEVAELVRRGELVSEGGRATYT